MSMSATPIAESFGARPLDPAGDELDQGAVVERAGQGVAVDRVDEGLRLAGDPALRRSEDQVQHDRGDQPGRDRDQGHVRPDRFEGGEDRRRVAPHADDRA